MADETSEDVVDDDELLWRAFTAADVVVEADGSRRLSSAVFRSKATDGISFHRAALTTLEQVLQLHPGSGIASCRAGDVRQLSPPTLRIVPDPVENEPLEGNDPSHALLLRDDPGTDSKEPTKSQAKRLRDLVRIERWPEESEAVWNW
jgi:hypothetical protein